MGNFLWFLFLFQVFYLAENPLNYYNLKEQSLHIKNNFIHQQQFSKAFLTDHSSHSSQHYHSSFFTLFFQIRQKCKYYQRIKKQVGISSRLEPFGLPL